MIEIQKNTPLIEIARDTIMGIKEKGFYFKHESDVDMAHQKWIVRLLNPDGTVFYESVKSGWREAEIDVHDYIMNYDTERKTR